MFSWDALSRWEMPLLNLIYQGLSSPTADLYFEAITNLHRQLSIQICIVLFFIQLFVFRGIKFTAWAFLAVVVTVGVSDAFLTYAFKNVVTRPRPFHLEWTEVKARRTGKTSQPSFPSNHATNSAALAGLGFVYHPGVGAVLAVISLLTGISRVYLGMHFPTDVLAGWILGACWGLFVGKKFFRDPTFIKKWRAREI